MKIRPNANDVVKREELKVTHFASFPGENRAESASGS